MTLLTKLLIAAGIVVALYAAGNAIHHSIYTDGFNAGQAKVRKENDDARAEADRLNSQIEKKDQALVVAKTEDKEKIVTIYRTIREQLDAQIIEVPILTACRVPVDSLHLVHQAAAGNMRANSKDVANHTAGNSTGSEK